MTSLSTRRAFGRLLGGGSRGEGTSPSPRLDTIRYLANYLIVNGVFKALSDPTRRQVLQLLKEGPKSAGEWPTTFRCPNPRCRLTSRSLREAGLVHGDKQGKAIIYRLKMSVLEEALLEFSQLLGMNLVPAHDVHHLASDAQERNVLMRKEDPAQPLARGIRPRGQRRRALRAEPRRHRRGHGPASGANQRRPDACGVRQSNAETGGSVDDGASRQAVPVDSRGWEAGRSRSPDLLTRLLGLCSLTVARPAAAAAVATATLVTITHGARYSAAAVIRRPPAQLYSFCSPRQPRRGSDTRRDWQGTLTAGPAELRLVLHLTAEGPRLQGVARQS
jgi:hypothetical protein